MALGSHRIRPPVSTDSSLEPFRKPCEGHRGKQTSLNPASGALVPQSGDLGILNTNTLPIPAFFISLSFLFCLEKVKIIIETVHLRSHSMLIPMGI